MDLIRHADPEAMRLDGVPAARFRDLYRDCPPWEIGQAQPEIIQLEGAGRFQGNILDIGCGSGENSLFLAAKGNSVLGIDFVEEVVETARRRAEERKLSAAFAICDALRLDDIGRTFDTLLDCATFHSFSDRQRADYDRSLRAVTQSGARFHLICFSDLEIRAGGPRRVSISDIWNSFGASWDIVSVRPTRYRAACFSDGARAWLAELRRR